MRGVIMFLLLKNQVKKIKKNMQYFISISLIILIVSISFTAFKSSVLRLGANYNEYLETQNVEQFYMMMGEVDVSYLGGTAIIELCTTYNLQTECADNILSLDDPVVVNNLNAVLSKAINENPEPYENLIDIYVAQFENRYNVEVEKQYVRDVSDGSYKYKFRSITYEIDIPYVIEGTLPYQNNEIMMYPEFMEHNDLSIGDTYYIKDIEYTITGSFYAPDYGLPIFSTNQIQYDESKQTLILANDATMKQLSTTLTTKYTSAGDLSLLFDEFNYQSVYNQDYSVLGREMQLIDLLVPRELNYRITALNDEVETANTFINLFLGLFTILTTILLLIFMKKYIDKNKRDIQILHAMGYSKNELSLSLMVFPFIVGLMSIIGYLIGLALSDSLFTLYSSRYYYPKALFRIDISIILYVIILPMISIFVLNYIYIRLRAFPSKKSQKRIVLPFTKYTPLRTQIISGFIFLVVSILLLFGLNSNSLFDTFKETTVEGNNYETFVMLRSMTNEAYSEDYEPFIRLKSEIQAINDQELTSELGTYIYGIEPTNEIKLLIDNNKENNLLLEDGVIISDFLKEHASLEVGDEITFTIGSKIVKHEIVGISNELIENNMFIHISEIQDAYNVDDTYYNGLFLTDNQYSNPNIYRRVNYNDALDELVIIFNTSSIILQFVTILSVLLAFFVFTILIISYLDDNLYNIATLKAIGYNNKEILYKYFGIMALLLTFSYIIAIPITAALFDVFVHLLIETMGFKFVIEMNTFYIIGGFILLIILYGIVLLIADKYFTKSNISLLLKKEEK